MRFVITVAIACIGLSDYAHGEFGDQLFRFQSPGPLFDTQFGLSAAIHGQTAIVGAPNGTGTTFLFDLESGRQLRVLDADGISIDIDSDVAIVGNPRFQLPGQAIVYDVETGDRLSVLEANDLTSSGGFGAAVAISDSIAIVGARTDNHPGFLTGAAYLFDVNTGQRLSKLAALDPGEFDSFGFSVDIDEDVAIVGSAQDTNLDLTWSGSAYVFDVNSGEQLWKLTAQDAQANDRFGESVAVEGNTLIVGSPHLEVGTREGAAYVFDLTTGEQLFKLTANDGTVSNRFGSEVALSGDLAIIGARHDDEFGRSAGAAYLFNLTTSQQVLKLVGEDTDAGDEFGSSVAIDNKLAVVGASAKDGSRGAAYAFSVPEPSGFALVLSAFLALGALRVARRPRLRRLSCQ